VDALSLEEFAQQFQRRVLVAPALDQHVQHLAFVVHRAPEEHPASADPNHHLIEMPSTRRRRPTPTQVRRDRRAKFQRPASDRLVADLDPALRQQLLHVPEAQGEAEVQPHRIADHVRREPVTLK